MCLFGFFLKKKNYFRTSFKGISKFGMMLMCIYAKIKLLLFCFFPLEFMYHNCTRLVNKVGFKFVHDTLHKKYVS